MKIIKPTIILFFVLLFSSFAYAQPPFNENQVVSPSQGLTIEYPRYMYIEQGQNFTLHTHVITSANGTIATNDTTNCFLHLYDKYGRHTLQADMDYEGVEFELYIDEGNFTTLGLYAYLIQCNGTLGGGFDSGNFEITSDGLEPVNTDSTSGFSIAVFMFLLTGMFYYAGTRNNLTSKPISSFIVKRCLFTLAIWLTVLTSAMVATIADNAGIPLTSEIFRMMWLFGWIGYLSMVYLVIKTTFDVIKMWKTNKADLRDN